MACGRLCILAMLTCSVVVAVCSQSDQRSDDISGLYLELLLTHISDIKHEVQQELQEFRELANTIKTDVNRILQQMPGRIRQPSQQPTSEVNANTTERFRTLEGEMLHFRTKMVRLSPPNLQLHGEWIVIQHRYDGSETFYRPWADYRNGFGALEGEHWLGLAKIHAILATERHELLVVLVSIEGETVYAHYDNFQLGDEPEGYALKTLGKYDGTAGDSLESHKDQKFSTYDRDNDGWASSHCAEKFRGAWWFKSCYHSHLNGEYMRERPKKQKGLVWQSFGGPFNSLKSTTMLIRRYVD
uniref:Uncharacterized protein n=1 Tax=Anopheles atroparvus TaxID=41427 RepID=A0A182J0D3_ANOAO